jgi:F-type H+-transporting ATPase subunit a
LCFLLINFQYVITQKLSGLSLFLPPGAPLFIIPFLLQIELISYFSRVISLIVRLFANMTSVHTLLKILSGFGVGLISAGGLATIISILPLGIILFVTGL